MMHWISLSSAYLVLAALSSPVAALELNLADSFETGDPADFDYVAGNVEVVPAGGVLASAALALNTAGNEFQSYDQVGYALHRTGQSPRRVAFSFDLLTVDLIGSNNQFVVIFDTPQIRNLIFAPDSNIEILNPGAGESGTVGSFADLQTLTVDILMDTAANLWEVRVGGALLYSDTVDAFAVEGIRLVHGASSGVFNGDTSSISYIDNLFISATEYVLIPTPPAPVPLPAAIWPMAIGAMTLLGRRRAARAKI